MTRCSPCQQPGKQQGSMLIEALVAILIFSMGILAIVGLQATSVKLSTDAKYRSDASLLANQLIGQMSVAAPDTATLIAGFSSPNGADYLTWVASSVQPNLPGVTGARLPTVAVVAVNAATQVTVTLRWQAPSEADASTVHSYIAIAQIRNGS